MVGVSRTLMKEAGNGINKLLTEFLVCPLSKQPLRYSKETNALISDAIGVSYPIKDGIPCLVPRDGNILTEDDANPGRAADASATRE